MHHLLCGQECLKWHKIELNFLNLSIYSKFFFWVHILAFIELNVHNFEQFFFPNCQSTEYAKVCVFSKLHESLFLSGYFCLQIWMILTVLFSTKQQYIYIYILWMNYQPLIIRALSIDVKTTNWSLVTTSTISAEVKVASVKKMRGIIGHKSI